MKKSSPKYTGMEIAVIGMSCRFPGANNIEEYWQLLQEGKSAIKRFSSDELNDIGVSEAIYNRPNYVPIGAYVKDRGVFDHAFFKFTPDEARMMTPQTRIFHMCAWEALEDAGINPNSAKYPIGIYAGASDNLIWRAHALLSGNSIDSFSQEQLASNEFLSTLVAYKLGLKGPAVYLNTACSTSLVAIHTACRALLTGEAKVALAGAVRVSSDLQQGYLHEEGMILSKDGVCRAFDKEANGTVGGEGGGIVVLKKLQDAIADGDRIYGIVKSSAVNNDGERKVGYTAPSVDGQVDCIKMALRLGRVQASEVDFIETHGTATGLGDAIELKALKKVFDQEREEPLFIGSLKTNLGHMDTAAGVGGFMKAILALYNRELPPSLNFSQPNEQIEGIPHLIEVAATSKKLESFEGRPTRAGVSSFGIGGTNAHCLLESFEPEETVEQENDLPLFFMFSAKTGSALKNYANKLCEYLQRNEDVNLKDVAYTLNLRKKNWNFRAAFMAQNRTDLLAQLKGFSQDQMGTQKAINKNVVIMLAATPVHLHLGTELYRQFEGFKTQVDRLMELAKSQMQFDLKTYWLKGAFLNENFEDRKCAFQHPLVFVLNRAKLLFLESLGINTDISFGHSLGEYVVACNAGVFSEETAIHLLFERGKLFDTVTKVPVYSLNASLETITAFGLKTLDVASNNSPSNCLVVVDSSEEAKLKTILAEQDLDYKEVNVGVAVHSRYLDGIKDQYLEVLQNSTLNKITTETYLNQRTKITPDQPEYWLNHLRQMVNPSAIITELLAKGSDTFIEIGAGQALGTFVKEHNRQQLKLKTIGTFRHRLDGLDEVTFFLQSLGEMWSSGINLKTKKIFAGTGKHIYIPTYAWDEHKFNAIAVLDFSQGAGLITTQSSKEEILTTNSATELLPQEPLTESEIILSGVFSSVFGISGLSAETNFFELGGDSLKAMICLKKLRNQHEKELTIKDFFEGKTIKEIARRMNEHNEEEIDFTFVRDPERETYPLSYNQKNYFSRYQFGEENIVLDLRLNNVSFDILKDAIIGLYRKHEILRVNYSKSMSGWTQKIVPLDDFRFPFESIAASEEDVEPALEEEKKILFDKTGTAFFRLKLLRLDSNDFHLIFTIHHSIADGASIELIRKGIYDNYTEIVDNGPLDDSDTSLAYFDFVLLQDAFIESGSGNKAKQYWLNKFENFTPIESRPITKLKEKIEFERVQIAGESLDKLNQIVSSFGITKQSFVQALIQLAMPEFFADKNRVLFSTDSGRYLKGFDALDLQNQIGFFVNLVPHLFHIDFDSAIKEVLTNVSQAYNSDLEYSAYPFEKLLVDLEWNKLSGFLEESMMLNYQNFYQTKDATLADDQDAKVYNMTSKFLMNILCAEYKNVLIIDIGVNDYNLNRIKPKEIQQRLEQILQQILNKENVKIPDLITLTETNK